MKRMTMRERMLAVVQGREHERAQQILAEGGPHGRLQIQISENVPAGRWRVSFPQIVRAIEEFGRPGR